MKYPVFNIDESHMSGDDRHDEDDNEIPLFLKKFQTQFPDSWNEIIKLRKIAEGGSEDESDF